ncbi:hypothetical protein RFI_10763 [Reticulomyxa filosa]|uniref:Uncharacterized protein n=1 Tax=Reticulomyxa filosa TaxID=46433 RepID=X6NLZ0_RETFI|nr:hypothetical protein RFI_10763 [Reticulomyxa filosa]|eukprot:ETO26372.1 hypothetical protein RFI_10763 [Reticulomyxa filosa]
MMMMMIMMMMMMMMMMTTTMIMIIMMMKITMTKKNYFQLYAQPIQHVREPIKKTSASSSLEGDDAHEKKFSVESSKSQKKRSKRSNTQRTTKKIKKPKSSKKKKSKKSSPKKSRKRSFSEMHSDSPSLETSHKPKRRSLAQDANSTSDRYLKPLLGKHNHSSNKKDHKTNIDDDEPFEIF